MTVTQRAETASIAPSIANDGLPHIIVSGLDNLGRRTIAELRLGDEPVVAIAGDADEGEGLVLPASCLMLAGDATGQCPWRLPTRS